MPTVALNARKIASLKPDPNRQIDYWDRTRRSFGLRVSRTGRKSWVVLYRYNGRLRRYTFATYPEMKLGEAREAADEAKKLAKKGTDPAAAKSAAREAVTFADLTTDYMNEHAKKHKRSWQQDQRMIDGELLPKWKHTKPTDIKRADVRALVNAIAERGAPIYANRVLALISKIFNYGIAEEKLGLDGGANPCRLIPRPGGAETPRDRVLNADEIRDLWQAFDGEEPPIRAVFKLRLLTAQRGGEVLSMRWEDLDLDGGWWTIPAERAKNGLSHRVPLSKQAQSVLTDYKSWLEEHLPKINEGRVKKRKPPREITGWVFPAPKGKEPMAWVQKAAERMRTASGVQFRPHDLRRTAASMMTGSGISRLVVSKILNHVETGVTAVYDRHSYDGEKRTALDAWGRQIEAILAAKSDGNVLTFQAKQAG